ncbi:hypothetical protein XELAEV_18039750mg [Xenopus laevis]|uniref:Uncharacterized protein n=1 Tax=Xenopus laevis TaxID=8355 RepID=A0A974H892_XENLA|nr:hypothetical protein XELAEV_18039750mg [Xenopus laevis]
MEGWEEPAAADGWQERVVLLLLLLVLLSPCCHPGMWGLSPPLAGCQCQLCSLQPWIILLCISCMSVCVCVPAVYVSSSPAHSDPAFSSFLQPLSMGFPLCLLLPASR